MPRTLAEKLLIGTGHVLVVGTDRIGTEAAAAVLELSGVTGSTASRTDDPAAADVAVLFLEDRDDLDTRVPDLLGRLVEARVVWLAYRKGNVVDINRDSIASTVTDFGWRAVTQIAVDATWSALRLRPLG